MKEIPELDTPSLRRFGLTFAAIIAALFGVIVPFAFKLSYPWWPWAIAIVFSAWSVLAPASLNGFYYLWMHFGLLINAVVSRIILGIAFYLVVLPTGLVFKMLGKDPMRRKIEGTADTYRITSETSKPEQMRKPF